MKRRPLSGAAAFAAALLVAWPGLQVHAAGQQQAVPVVAENGLGQSVFLPNRAGTQATTRAAAPPGLHLSAFPQIADVGDEVILSLAARSWPGPARASVSFASGHHGFQGSMQWAGSCSCFQIAVQLARRIHPLESARATSVVRIGGQSFDSVTYFQIRGLAPGGKTYAPGGATTLTGWVSDPKPTANEFQHFCAWVRTLDGFGVPGLQVRFAVHYQNRTDTWTAGKTHTNGLLCSNKSIGTPEPGVRVVTDVYAGSMHARTSFTPRS